MPQYARGLLVGRILHGAGAFTSDGALRDRSQNGVRLQLQGNALLPKSICLADQEEGIAHDCEVVWRKGRELGVRLTRDIALEPPADPRFAFLRRLYIENRTR